MQSCIYFLTYEVPRIGVFVYLGSSSCISHKINGFAKSCQVFRRFFIYDLETLPTHLITNTPWHCVIICRRAHWCFINFCWTGWWSLWVTGKGPLGKLNESREHIITIHDICIYRHATIRKIISVRKVMSHILIRRIKKKTFDTDCDYNG